jgi:pilus assembly protein Flp/PilA
MRNTIRRFAAQFGADSESGVTAIEYALIAALIAVTIIAAVTLVGTNLGLIYIGAAGKLVMPV